MSRLDGLVGLDAVAAGLVVAGAGGAAGAGAGWALPFAGHGAGVAAARIGLTIRDGAALRDDLRRRATVDQLTGLGTRAALLRRLDEELERPDPPAVLLAVFTLDGLRHYTETFGELAGDALLQRLARRLERTAGPSGRAFRPAGGRLAIVQRVGAAGFAPLAAAATAALSEEGEGFRIDPLMGMVLQPDEADAPDRALALADRRLVARREEHRVVPPPALSTLLHDAVARRRDVLTTGGPTLAELARGTAMRLGLTQAQGSRAAMATELRAVGKLAVPARDPREAGVLDSHEWRFVSRHTLVGERLVEFAMGAEDVARLVRSSHERFDGAGYPDGLAGKAIPVESRISAVCGAYEAMLTRRAPTGRPVAAARRSPSCDARPARSSIRTWSPPSPPPSTPPGPRPPRPRRRPAPYEPASRRSSVPAARPELRRDRDATRLEWAAIRGLLAALTARGLHDPARRARAGALALLVADGLGLHDAERDDIAELSALHDVGLIGVPDHVVHKPGPLERHERAQLCEHPVIGARIVGSLGGLARLAPLVEHEHEQWDGLGYPHGLAGEDIPLACRVVLACDAYVAMLHPRPDRPALEERVAREVLRRNAGSQFCPRTVEVLLGVLGEAAEPVSAGRRLVDEAYERANGPCGSPSRAGARARAGARVRAEARDGGARGSAGPASGAHPAPELPCLLDHRRDRPAPRRLVGAPARRRQLALPGPRRGSRLLRRAEERAARRDRGAGHDGGAARARPPGARRAAALAPRRAAPAPQPVADDTGPGPGRSLLDAHLRRRASPAPEGDGMTARRAAAAVGAAGAAVLVLFAAHVAVHPRDTAIGWELLGDAPMCWPACCACSPRCGTAESCRGPRSRRPCSRGRPATCTGSSPPAATWSLRRPRGPTPAIWRSTP